MNLDFLSQYFTEVRFAKGEILTRVGEVENYLYYLSEGIVRYFYYNPTTDKETTVDILFPESFCLSYTSFVKQAPHCFLLKPLRMLRLIR